MGRIDLFLLSLYSKHYQPRKNFVNNAVCCVDVTPNSWHCGQRNTWQSVRTVMFSGRCVVGGCNIFSNALWQKGKSTMTWKYFTIDFVQDKRIWPSLRRDFSYYFNSLPILIPIQRWLYSKCTTNADWTNSNHLFGALFCTFKCAYRPANPDKSS